MVPAVVVKDNGAKARSVRHDASSPKLDERSAEGQEREQLELLLFRLTGGPMARPNVGVEPTGAPASAKSDPSCGSAIPLISRAPGKARLGLFKASGKTVYSVGAGLTPDE